MLYLIKILEKNHDVLHKKIYSTKSYHWALNQHIRIISEGSCDTEDCNNGCWKISFVITDLNDLLKYIKTKNSYFNLE